ncbi:hypothetical protein [Streptomyces virginiae]|uniref:hypothetical protein n=1 Tax=Streptomyces virginiae TaxID=1961 RepID=UPI002DBA760F|nr:hypothetical protein [Streptomyces sp. CMAA1738]MEC4574240.1 hypothetical protein [Streptomyces sp. CMAA1738]
MADTIAKTGCVEECCGAVHVTIRREMEHVLWTDWHNPMNKDFSLADCRFSAHARAAPTPVRPDAHQHPAVAAGPGRRSCPTRTGETRRGLTALFRSNIHPYGTCRLGTDKRLDLLPALVPGPRRAADDGVRAAGSRHPAAEPEQHRRPRRDRPRPSVDVIRAGTSW